MQFLALFLLLISGAAADGGVSLGGSSRIIAGVVVGVFVLCLVIGIIICMVMCKRTTKPGGYSEKTKKKIDKWKMANRQPDKAVAYVAMSEPAFSDLSKSSQSTQLSSGSSRSKQQQVSMNPQVHMSKKVEAPVQKHSGEKKESRSSRPSARRIKIADTNGPVAAKAWKPEQPAVWKTEESSKVVESRTASLNRRSMPSRPERRRSYRTENKRQTVPAQSNNSKSPEQLIMEYNQLFKQYRAAEPIHSLQKPPPVGILANRVSDNSFSSSDEKTGSSGLSSSNGAPRRSRSSGRMVRIQGTTTNI